MRVDEVFTKYILKQIAGTVAYNSVSHTFHLSLRNISNTMREAIYAEGKKWGMSNQTVDDYVAKIYNEIELSYNPVKQPLQVLDISKDIKIGSQVILGGRDDLRGMEKINLLYLGKSKMYNQHRFIVLSSTRLILGEEDILEPADSTLWATGFSILFKVFRDGVRYPNDESVYRTFRLEEIILIKPSVIHDVIDSREEFTFLENSLLQLNNDYNGILTFGKNPMTLLMHSFSSDMPLYANFDENGIGIFESNPNIALQSSDIRNRLFGIIDDGYKDKVLNITTINPGEVYFDTGKGQVMPKNAAKGKYKVNH